MTAPHVMVGLLVLQRLLLKLKILKLDTFLDRFQHQQHHQTRLIVTHFLGHFWMIPQINDVVNVQLDTIVKNQQLTQNLVSQELMVIPVVVPTQTAPV